LPNLILSPPLPYARFLPLLARARIVLTDSGGVQEEASALGKPVIVLRDATERSEGFAAGDVVLAGVAPERLADLIRDGLARAAMPYFPLATGASLRIARILDRILEAA